MCTICYKILTNKRTACRHAHNHRLERKYYCQVCSKGFNDKYDLTRHTRTHTGVRPFGCDLCDKRFSQRISLEKHMRSIHLVAQPFGFRQRREKVYICEKCGFSSHEKNANQTHTCL